MSLSKERVAYNVLAFLSMIDKVGRVIVMKEAWLTERFREWLISRYNVHRIARATKSCPGQAVRLSAYSVSYWTRDCPVRLRQKTAYENYMIQTNFPYVSHLSNWGIVLASSEYKETTTVGWHAYTCDFYKLYSHDDHDDRGCGCAKMTSTFWQYLCEKRSLRLP